MRTTVITGAILMGLFTGCNTDPKAVQSSVKSSTDSTGPATAANTNEKYVYLTWGLPGPHHEAIQAINKRWGIEQKWIAGCIVSEELTDSAIRHNIAVDSALTLRHGGDWKQRYDAEIAAATKKTGDKITGKSD